MDNYHYGHIETVFYLNFPSALVIIDGTELNNQVPNTLGLQSQLYSDYKSSATLITLVDCDPSGYVVFISGIFTAYISDNAVWEQRGIYSQLFKY